MAASRQGKILEAAISRIRVLELDGLPYESVGILKVEETGTFVLPPPAAAVLASPRERLVANEGTNLSRVIWYPLLVILRRPALDLGLPDLDGQDAMFNWREAVIDVFFEKASQLIAAGAPSEVCTIAFEPGPILDVGVYNSQRLWQSRLQFWVKCEETKSNA